MKFPETNPRSPVYKMLSPLVERSPGPFYLLIPGAQMGRWSLCGCHQGLASRERAQVSWKERGI
jgi:hypothetical protein